MRDPPPGGGHRPPPKSRHGDGAGMGRPSGNSGSPSGERRGDSLDSGEIYLKNSSSVFLKKDLHDSSSACKGIMLAAGEEGDDRRDPPSLYDGAGLGPSSGDCVAASGSMESEIRSPGEHVLLISSPACKDKKLDGDSADLMELTHGVNCVSRDIGKGASSLKSFGNDMQIGTLGLETGARCDVQMIEDEACMASRDVLVSENDVCMASGDAQMTNVDVCMVFNAAASVNSPHTPPSSVFCMGRLDAKRAVLHASMAHPSCPSSVCANATSIPGQSVKAFGGEFNSPRPWESKNPAWKKPTMVPLLPVAELGNFSLDGTSAILDEEAVDETLKRFDHAIVGRLFGRRIPYPLLTSELSRRWGAFGRFRLITLSCDCFVCIFDTMEACDVVLVGGPWIILGQVLGIDRWSSTFSPSSLDGFKTPVWIRMPSLPLYCWGSKNISRIVALVGEPLCMDAATEQIDKGFFARACVRIDLSKPLKPGVWVQGRHGRFFQRLEYEGLSVFCYRCCQVGHKASVCKLQNTNKGWTNASPNSPLNHNVDVAQKSPCKSSNMLSSSSLDSKDKSYSTSHEIPILEHKSDDCEAGPWMMVQRKKKVSKGNQLYNRVLHGGSSIPETPNRKMGANTLRVGTYGNYYSCQAASNLMVNGARWSQNEKAAYPEASLPPRRSSDDGAEQFLGGSFFGTSSSAKGGRDDNHTPPPYNNSNASLHLPSSKETAVLTQDMECLHGNDQMQDEDRSTPFGQGNGVNAQPPDLDCSQALVPFEGSEKNIRTPRGRLSKTYASRMTNGLGPLISGDRNKKRKTATHNGGGDASPQKPP